MSTSEAETIITVAGGVGRIVLNRPRVLNALSQAQYHELTRVLITWEEEEAVGLVLLEGAGERAFCAGGDIRAVWDAEKRGDHAFNHDIFRTEYRLNRRINRFPKPYVSLLDGICMGGGAGLSINGGWRVATERTQFAMPETGIGFFPDVGATHFLNRCPGRLGLYLGLTGGRLGPADCLWAGLATHFVPVERLDGLREALAKAALSTDPGGEVEAALSRFHVDPGPGPMAARIDRMEHCFGADSLDGIIQALRADTSEWAWDTLEALTGRSPTSLAVTFRQLTEGRGMEFDQAIAREYRLACRFLAGRDLYEGIRAQVVDKDRRPIWSPASLSEVEEMVVDGYFLPRPGDELPLP